MYLCGANRKETIVMLTFKSLYYKITQYIPYTRAWKVKKRWESSERDQGSIVFSSDFAYT